MEKLTLNTGAQIPLLGLGTWDLRDTLCETIVSEAIEVGYRLIDTAQMYGNEKEVGRAIDKLSVKRSDLFITSKLDSRCNGYQQARDGIKRSLDQLNMDYIDLMLIHEPYSNDIAMYEALAEAYHDGKIKAIGISNYKQARFEQLIRQVSLIPAVNQVECHLQFQKWGLQQQLENHSTMMQAWSPLGQGKLNFETHPLFMQLSEKYRKSPAQIVLRFLTQRGVSVIPKTKRLERLKENISIFDFQLSQDEMKMIRTLDQGTTLFSWTDN